MKFTRNSVCLPVPVTRAEIEVVVPFDLLSEIPLSYKLAVLVPLACASGTVETGYTKIGYSYDPYEEAYYTLFYYETLEKMDDS